MKKGDDEKKVYEGFDMMMVGLSDIAKRNPGVAAQIAVARAEIILSVAGTWMSEQERRKGL